MALSFFFLFQVLCETFILNAVLVIAKNKLFYPAPFFFSKVFQGALFLFFISGDWWVWCFCAIDPCLSFASQRDDTVVFSTIFILVISGKKTNKKHRIIPLLFIPYPWLLVYTPLGKGQDIHLYVCLLFASLRYAWLNVVSSTWAPTSRSPLQESRGPEGLLPQTCSWLAKGDLLTWVFHHGKGDAKQEGLEVFQQAVGSDGKIWRLASK